MRASIKKERDVQKEITDERVRILFSKVEEAAREKDISQADYLIGIAREIGKKNNVRMPREYKRLYCKNCYRFISSAKRSKTRINSKNHRVEVTCLSCGKTMFYPIKSGKKTS